MTTHSHPPPQKARTIGILIHAKSSPQGTPGQRASTREVARWSDANTPVIYCDVQSVRASGSQLLASGWQPILKTDTWQTVHDVPLCGIYNRYPRGRAATALDQLAQAAADRGIPMANHPALQMLVRDKWHTQQCLEAAQLPIPEAECNPDMWLTQLKQWECAYLKPRYGAFGEGILYLEWPTSATTISLTGPAKGERHQCTPAELQPTIARLYPIPQQDENIELLLQRAIAPPIAGLEGFSIRSLLQQDASGQWHAPARVARCATDDPVANVARKASAQPLDDLCHAPEHPTLSPQLLTQLDQMDHDVARALQQRLSNIPPTAIVELGIDYVVDPQGQPWVLEINGFPQGRLGHLAAQDPGRFADIHKRVQQQPLITLWTHAQQKAAGQV